MEKYGTEDLINFEKMRWKIHGIIQMNCAALPNLTKSYTFTNTTFSIVVRN